MERNQTNSLWFLPNGRKWNELSVVSTKASINSSSFQTWLLHQGLVNWGYHHVTHISSWYFFLAVIHTCDCELILQILLELRWNIFLITWSPFLHFIYKRGITKIILFQRFTHCWRMKPFNHSGCKLSPKYGLSKFTLAFWLQPTLRC